MTCFDALGGFWRPFQCATVLGIRNTVKAAHRLWACQKICNAWESCWWSLGCLERPWNSCALSLYIYIYTQPHIYIHTDTYIHTYTTYLCFLVMYIHNATLPVCIYICIPYIHIYIIGSDGWCIHDIGRHAGFTLMYMYIYTHIMYTHINTYI